GAHRSPTASRSAQWARPKAAWPASGVSGAWIEGKKRVNVGGMTIDAIVDGETSRTLEYLYGTAPARERAEAQTFCDSITGELIMPIGSHLVQYDGKVV